MRVTAWAVGTLGQMEAGAQPAWRALRHEDYRAWADESLGDQRQVYARDRQLSPDGPLVFMPEGQAAVFRPAAHTGRLICPVPGCPSPLLTTRGPADRRHHFVHRHAPEDPNHSLAYNRRVAQQLLHDWASAQDPRLTVTTDETIQGVPVTVLVASPTGRRLAICFIDGRLGADAWEDHHDALRAADVIDAWIFGLRRMYCCPPDPDHKAGPDSPPARDRERGDLLLDRAVYRRMRASHAWPLLLSTERQQLANLIPPGELARRLGLRPPASAERVLHLIPHPLAGCRLCVHGIATPAVGEREVAPPPPMPPRPQREPAFIPAPPRRAPTPPRRSTLTIDAVQRRLPGPGGRTVYAALLSACGHDEEPALRRHLVALRADGHVSYRDPLGMMTAIDVPA